MNKRLLHLRHDLHRFPELSGNEKHTARRIIKFLKPLNPDLLIEKIGGNGVLAVFNSLVPGPEVLFRADIDALPVHESISFEYTSQNKGVSHKCGHDGHSTILAGLAAHISDHRPVKGRYLLLFQPAEETGQGASAVLNDPLYKDFNPDFCFALHNLPGFGSNEIVIRNGTFTAASTGMIIRLKGRSSHASEPEKGQSPTAVMAQLMSNLPKLSGNGSVRHYDDFVLLTVIYGNLGSPAFGTSPGEAVLMATLRAYLDSDMEKIKNMAAAMVNNLSSGAGLMAEITYTEEFPATTNHPEAVDYVVRVAGELGLQRVETMIPFRWSEDFAHFAGRSKAALFGIGAGVSRTPLHDPGYDFPDEILEVGVEIWKTLYNKFAFGG